MDKKYSKEEYNCEVVYTEVNSNEEIYQKLKNESPIGPSVLL